MGSDLGMTYPPLNTLKRVVEDLWVVDGPIVHFGMPWPRMPFPTRMTVIRLADGLFIHSPTALVPSLRAEIAGIGTPRWIVGPNRIHYSWIREWAEAFPHASIFLAPRIKEQAGERLPDGLPLDQDSGYPWDSELATMPIAGSYMTEIEFFHRASRTLVLTDLIENFEPRKLGSFVTRWLTWLGGVQDPHGSMPRDMRLTFRKQRPQLKAAVETMISWNPERVILAHGRWYTAGGAHELRRAFRWLLAE